MEKKKYFTVFCINISVAAWQSNFSFGINNGCYWSVLSVNIVKISTIFLKKENSVLSSYFPVSPVPTSCLEIFVFPVSLPPKLFYQAHEVLVSITVALRR